MRAARLNLLGGGDQVILKEYSSGDQSITLPVTVSGINASGAAPGQRTGVFVINIWLNYGGDLYYISGNTVRIGINALDRAGSTWNFGTFLRGEDSSGEHFPMSIGPFIAADGVTPLGFNISAADLSDTDHFRVFDSTGLGDYPVDQSFAIKAAPETDEPGAFTSDWTFRYYYNIPVSPVHNGVTRFDTKQVYYLESQVIKEYTAQLWLDDQLVAEEAVPPADENSEELTVTVDHPYVDNLFDAQYSLIRGATYVIASAFNGCETSKLLEKRQRRLSELKASGLADSDHPVITEALNVIGQTWMQQTALHRALIGKLSNYLFNIYHCFGIVAQEGGYYVDIKNFTCHLTARDGSRDAARKAQAFESVTFLMSALEHGVLEQLQVDRPATSTVRLLSLANEYGQRVYYPTNSAQYNNISEDLVGYSTSQKASFQDQIDEGYGLIIPEDGGIVLNEWTGAGYVAYKPGSSYEDGSSIQMIIDGGYYGGYASFNVNLEIYSINYNTQSLLSQEVARALIPSTDPVDMFTGAFLVNETDLSLGSAAPLGLAFSRSYSSSNVTKKTPLGNGWDFNYNMEIAQHSDAEVAFGLRQPADAAALLVASMVVLDLMEGTPDASSWVTSAIVADWGTDQINRNTVSVKYNSKALNFTKLPDGSFVSPPKSTAKLLGAEGGYRLEDRFGTVVQFNADDKVVSWADVDGNHMAFTYNTVGELSQISDHFGRSLSFSYEDGLLKSVTDSEGRSVTFSHDDDGNLTSFSNAEGKAWNYSYEGEFGHITSISSPDGVISVQNVYDALGKVKEQIFPRQIGATVYSLFISDYRSVERDSTGNGTVYYFDKNGQPVMTIDAMGCVSSSVYDGQGQIILSTDPSGNDTSVVYDAFNNPKIVTNALQQVTENVYDAELRLDYTLDGLNNMVDYEYDVEHHLLSTSVFPDGETTITTSNTYSPNGFAETSTDGRSTVTSLTYDAYGNPDTVKIGTQPAIDFDCDSIGQLKKITDQAGGETLFDYDNRGLITKRTDPFGKETTYAYRADGKLESVTDRNNKTTTYGYTPSGKIETVNYPTDTDVSFIYNQLDQVTHMADALGIASYQYDAVGRVTQATDSNGYTVEYMYDKHLLSGIRYATGKDLTYTYDELNRLKTISIGWLQNTPTATYDYDAAGRLTKFTNFNGSTVDYTYDNANRLIGLVNKRADGTVIGSYDYTLDGNGNRTSITEDTPNIRYFRAKDHLSYLYYKSTLNGSKSTRLDYFHDQTDWYNQFYVFFDQSDEGQRTSRTAPTETTTYEYDEAHRLTRFTESVDLQFFYDGGGNRLRAIRDGVETRYVYDQSGNLLAEADASGNPTRFYIHGHGLTAMVDAATGELYAYHFDGTGNTLALTNSNNEIVNFYRYTCFGVPATADYQYMQVAQPFTYSGQHGVMTEPRESFTQPAMFGGNVITTRAIYYARARYYDPETVRFISEDPAGFAGSGVNLYMYAGGNPIVRVDPNGEAWFVPGLIGGAIGAGFEVYSQLASGERDPWEISKAAVIGGATGALSAYAVGGRLAQMAFGAVASGGTEYLFGDGNMKSVITAASIGALSTGAGVSATKFLGSNVKTGLINAGDAKAAGSLIGGWSSAVGSAVTNSRPGKVH